MTVAFNPSEVASVYYNEIKKKIYNEGRTVKLVGLLCNEDSEAKVYSSYINKRCSKIGLEYELVQIDKTEAESKISELNIDPTVDGIIIFYPIYNDERDEFLRNKVVASKDAEGLSNFWIEKLYSNFRHWKENYKCILPSTSLSILKLLEAALANSGEKNCFQGKKVTIFNASNVVGLPLAHMLKNDGATVFSFDEFGGVNLEDDSETTRIDVLKQSDIVVTGVPSNKFLQIGKNEIKDSAVCLNFSEYENFKPDIKSRSGIYIPKIGSMTVAMIARNTVRLKYGSDS